MKKKSSTPSIEVKGTVIHLVSKGAVHTHDVRTSVLKPLGITKKTIKELHPGTLNYLLNTLQRDIALIQKTILTKVKDG